MKNGYRAVSGGCNAVALSLPVFAARVANAGNGANALHELGLFKGNRHETAGKAGID